MKFRTLEALQEHNAKVRSLKKEQNKDKNKDKDLVSIKEELEEVKEEIPAVDAKEVKEEKEAKEEKPEVIHKFMVTEEEENNILN